MQPIEVRIRQVGPWPMNSYALVCLETGYSALIDPGAEPDVLLEMLGTTTPKAILLTHTHADHIGALEEMRKGLNVPLMAHPGPHAGDISLDADRWLNHGDLVQLGNHTLQVFHTPGHIADQICFAVQSDPTNIVGDTIFDGGPGKTWSTEQFQTTLQTLRNVVLNWPDWMICYPGHGPHFRLGDKREAIEAFVAKDHGGFYGDATWDM